MNVDIGSFCMCKNFDINYLFNQIIGPWKIFIFCYVVHSTTSPQTNNTNIEQGADQRSIVQRYPLWVRVSCLLLMWLVTGPTTHPLLPLHSAWQTVKHDLLFPVPSQVNSPPGPVGSIAIECLSQNEDNLVWLHNLTDLSLLVSALLFQDVERTWFWDVTLKRQRARYARKKRSGCTLPRWSGWIDGACKAKRGLKQSYVRRFLG